MDKLLASFIIMRLSDLVPHTSLSLSFINAQALPHQICHSYYTNFTSTYADHNI